MLTMTTSYISRALRLELKFLFGVKPGLHISRKDRKHIVKNMYFKLYRYGLVSKWL